MITADQNLAVFIADLNNKLQAFHSVKYAGGTLLRPDNKLMCLLGTGTSAVAIQVNSRTLMADCITPAIEDN